MPTEEDNQTETQPAERPADVLDTPAPIGDGIETPPDPVSPAVSPKPAETIEDLGIAANEPYPQGNPRDPEDDFEAAHGFRRAPPESE